MPRFYDCPGHRIKLRNSNSRWSKGLTKYTDIRLKHVSDGLKGKPATFAGRSHSIETKRSISQKMLGNQHANHRGDRQSYYNGIRMDSKWEIGTAKYLDSINIIWKYSVHGYKLSNGRGYYPDFFIYVDGILIKLIEVKGYFRDANKQKFNMFLCEYPEIIVELWDRTKLLKLGIINCSGYVI